MYDYITRDVSYYAAQFTDKLIDAVDVLRSTHDSGGACPEDQERDDVCELIFTATATARKWDQLDESIRNA